MASSSFEANREVLQGQSRMHLLFPESRTEEEIVAEREMREIGLGRLVLGHSRPEPSFPRDYQKQFTSAVRVQNSLISGSIFVAIVAIIVVYALFVSGHLTTLPQDIAGLFTQANVIPLACVGAGFTVLVGGSVFVIYRALHLRKHPLLDGQTLGNFSVAEHLVPVCLEYDRADGEKSYFRAYLDLSGEGNKKYLYAVKGVSEHYGVSNSVFLGTIPYLIGTMVYDLLRLCIIPFYIATCLLIEQARDKPIFPKEGYFKPMQIPEEMYQSAKRAFLAPFYATALLIATLYSFPCPVNGRRWGAAIEFDWNEGVYRAEGRWLTIGPQKLHKGLEGGGGPEAIKKNQATTFPGCWHPIGVVEYEGEKENGLRAVSITRALLEKRLEEETGQPTTIKVIDEKQGYEYTVYFYPPEPDADQDEEELLT